MLGNKDKAATSAEATAQNYNRLNKSYQDSVSASRAKLEVGELLLALQTPLNRNQQKEYWAQFESMLKQYLDFRCSGVLL